MHFHTEAQFITCCLNPACHNPPNPDGTMFCSNCGVG
ncbi:4-Cys prefix domain-containing protein [Dendronalium sp. ChiSLP03b]